MEIDVLPIFFQADAYSLLKKNDYRFTIILLYDKDINSKFRIKLRKDYPDIHESTGQQTCVIDFDIPPRSWLEKYLNWFLTRYKDEILDANGFNSYDYLNQFGIDAYEEMRKTYDQYDIGSHCHELQKKILKIFDLNSSSFPLALVFDSEDKGIYAIREKISIHSLNEIAMRLGNFTLLKEIAEIKIKNNPSDLNLVELMEIIKEPFSETFYDFLDIITERKANLEQTESKISSLLNNYPEFEKLKFPEKFQWKPSLLKYINKHRNYLATFIKQVNLLETNPEANGLNIKHINNFKRFKINDSLRGLFYSKNQLKEFFAFGHHDLFL